MASSSSSIWKIIIGHHVGLEPLMRYPLEFGEESLLPQGLCTSYQSKTQVQGSISKKWGYGGIGQYLSHIMNKCHMYDPHMLNLTL